MENFAFGTRKLLAAFVCGGVLMTFGLWLITGGQTTTTVTMNTRLVPPHADVSQQEIEQVCQIGNFTVATHSSEVKSPTLVLILTYMRSGSSLTGDILQQGNEAFYIYEPLWDIKNRNISTYSIEYVNGTIRPPPFDFKAESIGIVRSWLSCDLRSLPTISFKDTMMGRGLKSQMYWPCYKNSLKEYLPPLARDICVQYLKKSCFQSPIRIIKTIRMRMRSLRMLFALFPELKVIHLVRDPRATLSSQANYGMCSQRYGGWGRCTRVFCTSIKQDIIDKTTLLEKYPNNFLTLFYEDLALQPLKTSKRMYEFVGTTFTRHAEEYVYNITMAGKPNNCRTCTTRSNSSEHVQAWKTTLDRQHINMIQDKCRFSMRTLNYTHL